ncbi:MAG: LLM class flavin-dependent oxidoreductase [Sandaracinaceae bacterium]|nr:LLM class flavin-dependent oxidoreductase [Sandaracinaceae bacterium]
MRHRISLHLTGSSAAELVSAARACEDAGVHSLIASELYTNPFVPLAAVAASTSRIGLSTGIALAFVRSPLSLALEALDLDALTGGRFTLGLGTGVKTLNEQWHGVTNFGPPVAHMREVVAFLRHFNAHAHLGQPIQFDGQFVKVHMEGYQRPVAPLRERIPIHLGANRSKMLELAGEVADGVLGHVFVSPRQLRDEVLPAIGRGLSKAGRAREDFTLGAGITCAIDDDRATARHHARGPLAFYATVRTYEPLFAADGFSAEVTAIRERFHAGDKRGAVSLVTDAMVDTYCAAGTPDEVLRKVAEYDGLLDIKGVSPPRHFCPPDAHTAYRARILEVFANA